ncbi:MAG TPA: hypothetical protein VLG49_03505 [Rhabdochlamydiaceae bacterium]|nr:hypothetical protein [Rhabdochlamydiaceae bacterium]
MPLEKVLPRDHSSLAILNGARTFFAMDQKTVYVARIFFSALAGAGVGAGIGFAVGGPVGMTIGCFIGIILGYGLGIFIDDYLDQNPVLDLELSRLESKKHL